MHGAKVVIGQVIDFIPRFFGPFSILIPYLTLKESLGSRAWTILLTRWIHPAFRVRRESDCWEGRATGIHETSMNASSVQLFSISQFNDLDARNQWRPGYSPRCISCLVHRCTKGVVARVPLSAPWSFFAVPGEHSVLSARRFVFFLWE